MAKPRPDAQTFFERAEWFHFTSLFLLTQPQNMAFIYSFPHIILKAFATEAYLKSLILIEGNTAPNIHHLLSLFDKLTPESQHAIRRLWDKECGSQLKKMRSVDTKGLKVPRTLREALNQSSDAFLEWRYSGPGAMPAFTIMSFPLWVRVRILELEPDWKPDWPNPLAWLNSEPEVHSG